MSRPNIENHLSNHYTFRSFYIFIITFSKTRPDEAQQNSEVNPFVHFGEDKKAP